MQIITAKKQKEIDTLNKKKMFFIARIVAEKHSTKKLSDTKLSELRNLVEGVFYADNVMESGL